MEITGGPANGRSTGAPLGPVLGGAHAAAANAALLLLADSRLPAGGHAHSGGLETAAATGLVTDLDTLTGFLRGRLVTAGLVAAGLAAAACLLATADAGDGGSRDDGPSEAAPGHGGPGEAASGAGGPGETASGAGGPGASGGWARLDAEADARTPSPAQRRVARAQGRALLRAALAAWPRPVLRALARPETRAVRTDGPHHPVVLGATVAVVGGDPLAAARLAAYGAVTGPASAAVRLLGLDPLGVHRTLAGLAGRIDAAAAEAAAAARAGEPPAVSAPALDLFAELHERAESRLFAS